MPSETAAIEPRELFRAKLEGIAAYHRDPEHHWWLHRRELPDGRIVHLQAMISGNLRVSLTLDASDCWFDKVYCYHDHHAAWRAALGWNGEGDPEGWYRDPKTGRRRPDNTPESEYVAP